MAQKLECEFVREAIDQTGDADLAVDVRTHLESCPACRAYGRVSLVLERAGRDAGSVSLWERFLEERSQAGTPRPFSFQVAGLLALGVVAVALVVGLTVGRVRAPLVAQTNVVASNSVVSVPASRYDYESSALDYYYEISMKY